VQPNLALYPFLIFAVFLYCAITCLPLVLASAIGFVSNSRSPHSFFPSGARFSTFLHFGSPFFQRPSVLESLLCFPNVLSQRGPSLTDSWSLYNVPPPPPPVRSYAQVLGAHASRSEKRSSFDHACHALTFQPIPMLVLFFSSRT